MTGIMPCTPLVTVEIGQFKTSDEYLDAAAAQGITVCPAARAAARHLVLPGVRRQIVLARTTLKELRIGLDREKSWSSDAEILEMYPSLERCSQEALLALAARAVPLSEVSFCAEWFVAPKYKSKKNGVVQEKGNHCYCLTYENGHVTVSRTGSGTNPGNGGGEAYGHHSSILLAIKQ